MLLTECALAVEVSDSREWVSVGAAGWLDGVVTVALAEYLPRTVDVVPVVARIRAERRVLAVVVDPRGNASNRIRPLRKAGIKVSEPSAGDVVAAHGEFLDRLAAGTLRHVRCAQLDAAIASGAERRVGFARAWDRRVSGPDGAPAWAVELAMWGLLAAPKFPPAEVFGGDDFGDADRSFENPNVPLG